MKTSRLPSIIAISFSSLHPLPDFLSILKDQGYVSLWYSSVNGVIGKDAGTDLTPKGRLWVMHPDYMIDKGYGNAMDKFSQLSERDRINDVLYIIENYYSLAVTLTTGDVLLGDPTTDLELQYLPYSEKYKERKDYDILRELEKPISDKIVLLFPDGRGYVYGHEYAVIIPITLIARIQGLEPLINISPEKMTFSHPGGSLALRNLPNPLSQSIKIRNFEIINRLGLVWCDYNEEALSEEAISGRNVILQKEIYLYVDWDYFKNINGGLRNLGGTFLGVGISAGITRSNSDLVSIKLHENPSYEGLIRKAQEEQRTIIEGDEAQMYDLRVTDTSSRSVPLLIKDKCLIVPKEFIHQIDSPLTVFGELHLFPIMMNGQNYESYLLARAIGFIPHNSGNP